MTRKSKGWPSAKGPLTVVPPVEAPAPETEEQKPQEDDAEGTEAEAAQAPNPAALTLTKLTGSNELVMPGNYVMTPFGVWVEKQLKDDVIALRVAWTPLVVSAVYTDPDGNQSVELAWTDRHRVVRRIVPRSVARRGRILVATLGDAGLPVIEADAKLAERWLAAFESYNEDAIPQMYLARQLGWQDDGTFVATQDGPYRVEVKFDEQKPALAAHAPHGTFQGWQTAIKRLEAYPVAQMALYACLAAPLLELLGVNSFTVDISGRSTRGKTTAAMAGMSLWADPSEKADGLYSWRTTMLAAEKRLNLVNGLPVVFDETKLVRDPEMVHGLLYQIPKNHGQARGGGWPSGLPWRTVVLSTGEQSVLTFTTDQGAAARVLALAGAPFGTEGDASAAAAIEVRDGCSEHFGIAGPMFIEKLQDLLADGGKRKLVARHRKLTDDHRYDSDMSARRSPMVACLALAAELGHAWGIVPFAPPPAEVWARLFSVRDQTDNRGEMALDVVREHVASHGSELWSPYTEEKAPFSGWIGRDIQIDKTATVALLPQRLRDVLTRAGYDLDAVLPSWLEAGALVENPKSRPAWLIPKKLDGRVVRMLVFAPGWIVSAETDHDDGE